MLEGGGLLALAGGGRKRRHPGGMRLHQPEGDGRAAVRTPNSRLGERPRSTADALDLGIRRDIGILVADAGFPSNAGNGLARGNFTRQVTLNATADHEGILVPQIKTREN